MTIETTEIGPNDRLLIHAEGADDETMRRMGDMLRDQHGQRIILMSGEFQVLIVRGAR